MNKENERDKMIKKVVAANHRDMRSALIPHHALLLPNGSGFVGDSIDELELKLKERFSIGEIEDFFNAA